MQPNPQDRIILRTMAIIIGLGFVSTLSYGMYSYQNHEGAVETSMPTDMVSDADTYQSPKNYEETSVATDVVNGVDEDGYIVMHPEGGFVPNPNFYPNAPTSIPPSFYRYVKDCYTRATIEKQRIYTDRGYTNYVGGDRYEAQCVLDGTMDTYYVESIDRLD